MNTATLKLTFVSLVSFAALSGCAQQFDLEESEGVIAEEETVQQAEQAIGESLTFFRLRFKHTTDAVVQGQRLKPSCMEPVAVVKSAPVVQRDCHTGNPGVSDSQSFYLSNPSERVDGRRMIVSAKDPAYCLMIAGYWAGEGALDNGAALVMYLCDPARDNQWFYPDFAQADGYSALKVHHSGRMLNVPGSSLEDHAIV